MRHVRRCSNFLRNSSRLAGGLLLLALWCLSGIVWSAPFPPDPVEEMRQALLLDRDAGATPEALNFRKANLERRAAALRSLGDLSRALLLREWRYESLNPDVARLDQSVWDGLRDRFSEGVRSALKGDNPVRARAVAELLGEMAASAQASGVRTRVVQDLLTSFGPDLARQTGSSDAGVRRGAIRSLGMIGADPKVAAQALRRVLQDDGVADRRVAATALGTLIRTSAESEKKAGTEVGPTTSVNVVGTAVQVVPVAGLALGDDDVDVRRLAADALEQTAASLADLVVLPASLDFPPAGRTPTAEERERMEDYRAQVQREWETLLPLMKALREQGPALARVVNDPDDRVRMLARRTLEEMAYARQRLIQRHLSVPPETLKPPMKERTELPREATPVVRVAALEEENSPLPEDPLLPALNEALQPLIRGLSDQNVRNRLAAIDALEMMGTDALPAAPALIRALSDCDMFVRWAAARTLGRLREGLANLENTKGLAELTRALPGLERMLCDEDLDLRLVGAASLGQFAQDARPSVPALAKAVNCGDVEARIAAVRALAAVGTDAAPAIPALIEALSNTDPRLRREAAGLLGRFGPLAREAESALRKALNDADPDVRRLAADALLNITRPQR